MSAIRGQPVVLARSQLEWSSSAWQGSPYVPTDCQSFEKNRRRSEIRAFSKEKAVFIGAAVSFKGTFLPWGMRTIPPRRPILQTSEREGGGGGGCPGMNQNTSSCSTDMSVRRGRKMERGHGEDRKQTGVIRIQSEGA